MMPDSAREVTQSKILSMLPMSVAQMFPIDMVLVPPRTGGPKVRRTSSPAEPHSVPKVHIRNRYTKEHHWMTREQWDQSLRIVSFGDTVELLNGWGQVTKRIRY